MRRNWMPLYIPDFLADTMHLTAAETGAYLCLIMDYWLHDGLPDDDHKLAAIARLPLKAWRLIRPTIEAFFHDGWQHKRIDAELTKMVGTSIRRQEAASKAGTISAIKRANGTSTQRARNVHAALTPRARGVHHTTQEDITSTFSVAARARATPAENPENSTVSEPPQQKESGLATAERAEKPRITASDGLAEVIQKKGWV